MTNWRWLKSNGKTGLRLGDLCWEVIVSCLWEERSECVVASSLAVSGGKEHLIFSAFGDVEDECEAIQEINPKISYRYVQ
ncbi:hypothetical protein HN51_017995 [Arachis hypogaea]